MSQAEPKSQAVVDLTSEGATPGPVYPDEGVKYSAESPPYVPTSPAYEAEEDESQDFLAPYVSQSARAKRPSGRTTQVHEDAKAKRARTSDSSESTEEDEEDDFSTTDDEVKKDEDDEEDEDSCGCGCECGGCDCGLAPIADAVKFLLDGEGLKAAAALNKHLYGHSSSFKDKEPCDCGCTCNECDCGVTAMTYAVSSIEKGRNLTLVASNLTDWTDDHPKLTKKARCQL
jgi:hypothetical protein